jgi:hypothetical protein
MTAARILALLLALSIAINIGFLAGLIAHQAGAPAPRALMTGAGAVATILGLYFAAIAAYQ